MKSPMKKILAVAVAALGLAAVAAPKVTIDKIEDGDVWSTKKVTYTVSDVPAETSHVGHDLAFDVTAYSVTTNIKMGVAQNGTFTYMLDTAAIFGETRKDPKAKIRVSVERKGRGGVQLWENGPYFAECNVGATKPQDYGYYFWWGDTVGYKRNGSSWVSVKDGSSFSFSSSNSKIKTYNKSIAELYSAGYIDANSADGKLKPEYDAARAHLGAPWRMMTKAELDKLVDTTYCTRTWVTSYNGKSVKGYVVKGAQDPYKNKEVFFPAAGYGNGSSLFISGSYGFYWSSTPNSSSYDAWLLYFYSSYFSADDGNRYLGFTVRPVRGFAE